MYEFLQDIFFCKNLVEAPKQSISRAWLELGGADSLTDTGNSVAAAPAQK